MGPFFKCESILFCYRMLLSDDIPFYSWYQHIPQAMSRKLWRHHIDRIFDKNVRTTSRGMLNNVNIVYH